MTVVVAGIERRCGRCGGELWQPPNVINNETGEPEPSKYRCRDCGTDHMIVEVGIASERSVSQGG